MPDQYISELLNRLFHGTISVSEKESLARWVQESGEEDHLKEMIQQSWQQFETQETLPQAKANELLQSILFHAKSQEKQPAKLIGMHKRSWGRIAVAASILLALGIGSYFIFFNQPKQNEIVKTDLPKDVEAPKGTKAMITLANGQKVLLDSLTSGTLAIQGNVNVVKTADGQIVYNGSSTEIEYNTMFNPRGSKVVNLTLSDGTKVWLNSESSLRYPIAFAGNERGVEITGEAYFEVAKDAKKKFIVSGNGVTTEVLGTHFNVNTYTDESSVKVTLLEGSVKVTKAALTGLLKPGQQAQVSSEIKVVNGVDVDEVMAWKNGRFQFNKASLQEVMRQIARWYDVEISYEGKITPQQFGGKMQRDLNLSEVLDGLAKSQVHFRIEGKKVVVMP